MESSIAELMLLTDDEAAFKEAARRYQAACVREYHIAHPRKRKHQPNPIDKGKTIWDNLFINKTNNRDGKQNRTLRTDSGAESGIEGSTKSRGSRSDKKKTRR